MFESIIKGVNEKHDLGDKAGALVSGIFAMMTDSENGGFAGFINRFREVGLGDLADSWVSSGANTPISYEQIESAFGDETLRALSNQVGTDYKTTVEATEYVVPHLVDELTPNGEIPSESDLLLSAGAFLDDGVGTSSGGGDLLDDGGESFDRVDPANTTKAGLGDKDEINNMPEIFDADGDKSPLSWLLPLIITGILVVLGYWFCTAKSEPVANVAPNANKTANVNNTTNANSTAKTTESSFRIEAKDGKYTVSGVVPDQATLDKIKAALTAQFGEENVNLSGLKVDASAKPFEADWWMNFERLLPGLKDWKNGSLAFAGRSITAASGVPQAVMDQMKGLFLGWTMPSGNAETAANENRTLTEVSLPDGTKLQAYPNGIEDQLIKFIESDEYKNGSNDSLKNKWFNFDDLNFKFGTTELVPESKRQLDNIVAILKAFPDVKIKIGGYTDKKGDDAANKKLSDNRAKAVKAALEKAGVGAQVPEAEGYGEEFATVAETASDDERKVDRKTAVRLLK